MGPITAAVVGIIYFKYRKRMQKKVEKVHQRLLTSERVEQSGVPTAVVVAVPSLLSELMKWSCSDILQLACKSTKLLSGPSAVARLVANGRRSKQLTGHAVVTKLKEYIPLTQICINLYQHSYWFSGKEVIARNIKAQVYEPAFVAFVDHNAQAIRLAVRGTWSANDAFTCVDFTDAEFNHRGVDKGGKETLIHGRAHGGMLKSARWIFEEARRALLQALKKYPTYKLKVVGHSLGGATGALLVYMLRECEEEFKSAECVCFGPAACMTWELAEFGAHFVETVINGGDLVCNLSTNAMDEFRTAECAQLESENIRKDVEAEGGVNKGLYPPGKITHIVRGKVAMYETDRAHYGTFRLSFKMFWDHDISNYRKGLEKLLSQLREKVHYY